ncbi:MAG: hypothetical protein JKY17_08945 [Magnetovibrio sp.]|nr:hypothetical protein [Magnetovibrio sp.]
MIDIEVKASSLLGQDKLSPDDKRYVFDLLQQADELMTEPLPSGLVRLIGRALGHKPPKGSRKPYQDRSEAQWHLATRLEAAAAPDPDGKFPSILSDWVLVQKVWANQHATDQARFDSYKKTLYSPKPDPEHDKGWRVQPKYCVHVLYLRSVSAERAKIKRRIECKREVRISESHDALFAVVCEAASKTKE